MKKIFSAFAILLTSFLIFSSMDSRVHAAVRIQREVQQEPHQTKEQQTEKTETGDTPDLGLVSPSVLLMEPETGSIVYEKNARERRSPASITKIMTLLLIFDELDKGTIQLQDEVTTSAYAKSMGGSQVFLEEGEKQSVETMIKCIVVASGNDASVAMAEHLSGTEQEFVSRMNAKAASLGMEDTHFEDCCGLTESDQHYTSALDVAKMSRELIGKHPEILSYSSIWMEDIMHVTRKETKSFTLTNTNKLLRSYEGCVGLKTGSTSKAKYCVSAVAQKGDLTMLAVVMGAPDYKIRFSEAASLFNFGFGTCRIYIEKEEEPLPQIPVVYGTLDLAELEYAEPFRYFSRTGEALEGVVRKVEVQKSVKAPVKKGENAGRIRYFLGEKELGSTALIFKEDIPKIGFWGIFSEIGEKYLLAETST